MNQQILLRVIDAWDYLNEVAFKGELTRPLFKVDSRLFSYIQDGKEPLYGGYDTSKRKIYLLWKDKHKLETLYHEMCHQFIHEFYGEKKAYSHGKLFKEVYKKGLEMLEARGVKYAGSQS